MTGLVVGLVMSLGSLGCGIGIVDNQSGGAEHLPTQGAGPYGKLPLDVDTPTDEPFVVVAFPNQLRDPSALTRDDGGFRLWFSRQSNQAPDASEIWHAELADFVSSPDVPPEPTLLADAPWEQGWVSAPSVVRLASDHLVMLYQGGVDTPAIGRADSMDNGLTWSKHPSNPILEQAMQPTLAYIPDQDVGDQWLLFVARPDRAGIFRADSSDGVTWDDVSEPMLEPRVGVADAFDGYALFNPHIVVRATASGQRHYGLFFNAIASADPEESVSIGWAGSFDGMEWHRFESPDAPILAPEGASEYAPCVLLEPDQGIMFYNELTRGVQGIAVAVHP